MNLRFENLKNIFRLLIRHGIVSLFSGAIEYSIFLLLFYQFQLDLNFSYFISFTISVFFNYLGHSFYTFNIGRMNGTTLLFYIIQVAITLIIGYLLFGMLLYNNMEPFVAKGLQLFSTFFFNVLFGNFISFKKRL